MKLYTVAVVIVLGAAGCSREPETARHTVEQYRADKSLRQEVFGKCANDPGTLGSTPDCINAREAERLESYGKLRDLRPLGFDPKKRP